MYLQPLHLRLWPGRNHALLLTLAGAADSVSGSQATGFLRRSSPQARRPQRRPGRRYRGQMEKEGILKPLDASHPSFTNRAQSFCRHAKLPERPKGHDSLETVFKTAALNEREGGEKARGLDPRATSCDRSKKTGIKSPQRRRPMAEMFCGARLLLLWRWYREKPTAFSPRWRNNRILFPRDGEHYSPSLGSTMGRLRRAAREHGDCDICCSHRTAG